MMGHSRQPSTALAILLCLRDHHPGLSLRAATTFLMVCENEDVSVSELAYLLGDSSYNVSRSIDQLNRGEPNGSDRSLVERIPWHNDARLRVVRLTPLGRCLRQDIDTLVAAGRTLLPARGLDDASSLRPSATATVPEIA